MWFSVEEAKKTGGQESKCGFYFEGQWWGLVSTSTLSSQRVLGRADRSSENPPASACSFPVFGQCQAPPHCTWPSPPSKKGESLSQELQSDKEVFHSGGVN